MTSNSTIGKTEITFLNCLKKSLKKSDGNCKSPSFNTKQWAQIIELAQRHEVLALLESIFDFSKFDEKQQSFIKLKIAKTVHTAIRLQELNSRITQLLEKEGIKTVTLKGISIARLYPVPEFRKTSDIDLFFFCKEDAEKAANILCEKGFKFTETWQANHHLVMISEKSEVVELHVAWVEIFKDKHLNSYLERLQNESARHCRPIDYHGTRIYVYDTSWQGFYLLIHMLQHFVASGFGLRNLCDWVVLWENCNDEKARNDFYKMACNSGTEEFAKAVTSVCVKHLGLSRDKSPCPSDAFTKNDVTDALLRDILDAGEFGYSESERMVGMDGNSFVSYIKELHHQMHINFPKAGKVIFFWPVLWLATLIRFLINNKKLNRAPLSAIMKKAGKRGKLVRQLMPKR